MIIFNKNKTELLLFLITVNNELIKCIHNITSQCKNIWRVAVAKGAYRLLVYSYLKNLAVVLQTSK